MIDQWIEIPYPPSVNHYWGRRGIKKGKAFMAMQYLTAKAKTFRAEIVAAIAECGMQRELGALHLMIDQRPPDRRKRDIDNIVKPIMDALEHAGAYENDNQVARLSVVRGPVEPQGTCYIKIERIEQ